MASDWLDLLIKVAKAELLPTGPLGVQECEQLNLAHELLFHGGSRESTSGIDPDKTELLAGFLVNHEHPPECLVTSEGTIRVNQKEVEGPQLSECEVLLAEKTVQSLPFKRSMALLSKMAGRVANHEYSRAVGFRADSKTKTLTKFNKPCKEAAICFTSTVDSVNRFASALTRSSAFIV
eukprot:s866_g15.t1